MLISSLPGTPRYFNLVSIPTLEYTFLHISVVFVAQDRSSDVQTPNSFLTVLWSILVLLTFNQVANSTWALVNTR